MEWMLMPYKRYFDFSGRSRRKEYWMFVLLAFIVYILLGGMLFAVGMSVNSMGEPEMGGGGMVFAGLLGIFVLASLIPSLAVQVRRFHDQDKSGWFVLINFVPYIGGLIVLVFMCLEGTRGPNRFGPDPKDPNSSAVFS